MRRLSYRIGTSYETRPVEDPWRRRMPAQIYIGPDLPRGPGAQPRKPMPFGKRGERPTTVMTTRRFSFARLFSLLQGPRNTRRTKVR
jgi:hypothetical protein